TEWTDGPAERAARPVARAGRRVPPLWRASNRGRRLLLAPHARRSEAAAAVLPRLRRSRRDQPRLRRRQPGAWGRVVPPTGFEPVISTLKGWRPRPLDDGGPRPVECTADPLREHPGIDENQLED